MPTIPRGVIVFLTITGLALAAMAAYDFVRPAAPEEQLQVLRQELAKQRSAADSCRVALEREESALRARDTRLDSLKERIDQYELLHPSGVPADSYQLYIEAFNEYNYGIPNRNAAAEKLQALWLTCREMALKHNATADSARKLAGELGLIREFENLEANH